MAHARLAIHLAYLRSPIHIALRICMMEEGLRR
jgi:hypothetical protein